jgi:hypothetical protein
MLTANRLLTLLFCFAAIYCSGQDTVDIKPFERYWTKPRLVPKVGFGVQETGFGEIGAQLHKIYVHPLSLASAGPYVTVDAVFTTDEIILGPKAGYEITAGLFGAAADITYYTDFDREVLMVTPKAGLSVFGYVNLFYGRNIRLSDDSFKSISPNRFSLIFNLNRDYNDIRSAGKKVQRNRDQK